MSMGIGAGNTRQMLGMTAPANMQQRAPAPIAAQPQQPGFMGQYQQWRGAKAYEAQNPSLFQRMPMTGWGGGGGTVGDGMISNRGLGGAVDWQAKAGPFRRITPEAQGYAKYKNDMRAEQSMTELAGYLERTKGMNSNNVLRDLAGGGIDQYAQYVPEFTDWRGRETQRRNATGMMSGTLGKLLTSVGPALVTGGAALPMLGRMGMGAMFGGAAGGPMGALKGGMPSPMSLANRFAGR